MIYIHKNNQQYCQDIVAYKCQVGQGNVLPFAWSNNPSYKSCARECDLNKDCTAFDFTLTCCAAAPEDYACRLFDEGNVPPRDFGGIDNRQYCAVINDNKKLCTQYNALSRTRSGPISNNNQYKFVSNKGYLQSRVKLYHQNYTFSYNPYFKKNTLNNLKFPPSTYSLYLSNKLIYYEDDIVSKSCFTSDCSCIVPISFKPKNF